MVICKQEQDINMLGAILKPTNEYKYPGVALTIDSLEKIDIRNKLIMGLAWTQQWN